MEARRQARLANKLLHDPPLILLLAAQTAQLGGDETAARRYFTAMLERPETAFLGLRGLLMQALKAGDRREALELARRAYEERPKTGWAITTLLDLHLESGDWDQAMPLLLQAGKLKALPEAEARRKRAVLLAEKARVDPAATALPAAREAVKLAPEMVPARAQLARLLIEAGRQREATKVIEQGWSMGPHPELAAAYAALQPEEAPIARYRRFEKLSALAPRHRESLLALAECAMAAGLWGEARKDLEFVAEAEHGHPSQRLARLMVRLAEGERGDAAVIRRWSDRRGRSRSGARLALHPLRHASPGLAGQLPALPRLRYPRLAGSAARRRPLGASSRSDRRRAAGADGGDFAARRRRFPPARPAPRHGLPRRCPMRPGLRPRRPPRLTPPAW